jgi:PleD family two-component response regulator
MLGSHDGVARAVAGCDTAFLTGRVSLEVKAVNGDGTDVRKTISIGLATMEGEEDMGAFIARADALMYEAKKEGGNMVRLAL